VDEEVTLIALQTFLSRPQWPQAAKNLAWSGNPMHCLYA
jgi:hypothetical protein